MGSSPDFLEIFTAEPNAGGGVPFARFMELALYHPAVGYYTAARTRVGISSETDFHTATSVGPVFGELVVAAAARLLGPAVRDFVFVEIGAEPSGGILAGGVPHPFASAETRPLGSNLQLPPRAVVFSNELFDAQPCHRLVRRRGAWRELGVAWRDGQLVEVELPEFSREVHAVSDRLPAAPPEGYQLDLPLRAVTLLTQLAAQDWRGLFLAFDYGRTWHELAEEMPQGSVRAYFRHRQHNDLLAQPGTQDLTCHVCWDWLVDGLAAHGFADPKVESQESFFAHHTGPELAALMATEAGRFSPRKQALLQLLHPGQMGQKFQVLHATRR